MRVPLSAIAAFVFAQLAQLVSAQSFTNLNFESANVSNPDSLHSVPFANAFPGWQAVAGETYPSLGSTNLSLGPVSRAYHDSSDLDQITIGIYDYTGTSIIPSSLYLLVGKKTPYIESDLGSMHTGVLELYQSGLIPANATSLTFRTITYSSMAGVLPQLVLKLNGASIPYLPTGSQGGFTTYAADVSSLANTVSELRFSVRSDYPFPNQSSPDIFTGLGLDAIAFSTSVPEPSTGALLIAALVAIKVGRKFSRGPRTH
jgi:hypothetical protein